MNFYRRFPGDYARDTQHLTMAQNGAYTLLLDTLYSTEKKLPKNPEFLYRICRATTPDQAADVDLVIREFFVLRRRGYTNKRFEEELKHAESRVKAARQNGKNGGRPKTQQKPSGLSKVKPTGFHSANPAKSSPDSRLQTPEQESPNPTVMQKLGISLSLWGDYKRVREELGRPIVSGAEDSILTELLAFQSVGQNPVEIVTQAVRTSSWKFYPVRKENTSNANRRNNLGALRAKPDKYANRKADLVAT